MNMKKILIAMAALLPLGLAAEIDTAELTGKWVSKPIQAPSPDPSFKQSTTIELTFTGGDKVAQTSQTSTAINGGEGVFINIDMYCDCEGTYTISGDTLVIHSDPSTLNVDFSEDNIRIKGLPDPDKAEEAKSQMVKEFQQVIPEMQKAMAEPTKIWDLVITEKKVTCQVDSMEVTFTRKKK